MIRAKEFEDKLATLPQMPGVYLMKDRSGKIIYVGKSKCLKNRVSSYFHSYGLSVKTQKLVSHIYDFEIIITSTEAEALVLENELIKRHNPKYNIKLKDAKTYPYIELTTPGGFPKLRLARKRSNKNAKYFGPYTSSLVTNDIIKTIQKTFRIPDCNKLFSYGKRVCRPCLAYHLDNCLAPCTGEIKTADYEDTIKQIECFLKGEYATAIQMLTDRMIKASDDMRFEDAAKYRDSISNLKKLSEKQNVISAPKNEDDVFGFYETESLSCITVLKIHGGIISDKESIYLAPDEINDTEALCDLILRFYENYDLIPRNIYISFELSKEEISELSSILSELSLHKVNIHHPLRGDKVLLCTIAVNNSKEAINTRLAVLKNNDEILVNVAGLLQLETVPERIEGYDVSNFGTTDVYTGMIVLENNKFNKKLYRSFSIKNLENQDDYTSMAQAVTRRLKHINMQDDDSLNTMPDLILVDGGTGHVNAVKNVVEECGFYIPVFGMVKDSHHKTRTLTDGQNEISIAKNQEMYNFFFRIQEEVHRFTFSKMDTSRRRNATTSTLCEINGVGKEKAKLLLSHFKTLDNIKKASYEQLTKVSGISENIANNIIEYFKNQENV